MVRLTVLLVVVAALVLGPAAIAVASENECVGSSVLVGCPNVGGDSNGTSVTLTGTESIPGQTGTSGSGGGVASPPPLFNTWLRCFLENQTTTGLCDPADPDSGIPTITISDIATFIPTPGRQQMEPDGWTVAGLDTNFYAITGQHVVNGTLLGRPADVRFTPTTYLWAYGDGSRATKTTKGGTWDAQGIPEFEPTPTSHVYDDLGDYTITLDIVFAAEYRFAGGPWRPVVGTITLPANDLHIRVGTAKTVLVEHDCEQNPAGPGC
jgi:hypothetical protein